MKTPTMQILTLAAYAGVASLLIACGDGEHDRGDEPDAGARGADEAPREMSAMEDRLADATVFDVAIDATVLSFEAAGSWVGDGSTPRQLEVPIRGGFATVVADAEGMLTLTELEIALEDLQVGESISTPLGSMITDLSLSLVRPASAEAKYDDVSAEAADALSIELSWTLSLPTGNELVLAPQRVDGVPFDIDVSESSDGLVLALDLAHRGDIISLEDVVRVTAIDASLEAVAR